MKRRLHWTHRLGELGAGDVETVTRDHGGFRIAQGYDEWKRKHDGLKYALLRGHGTQHERDTGETFRSVAEAKARAEQLVAEELGDDGKTRAA